MPTIHPSHWTSREHFLRQRDGAQRLSSEWAPVRRPSFLPSLPRTCRHAHLGFKSAPVRVVLVVRPFLVPSHPTMSLWTRPYQRTRTPGARAGLTRARLTLLRGRFEWVFAPSAQTVSQARVTAPSQYQLLYRFSLIYQIFRGGHNSKIFDADCTNMLV